MSPARRPASRGTTAEAAVSSEPGKPDADDLAALEEERRFLLDSLRDLDDQRAAGDIDEGDYESLHEDYTARAAAVLHRIEEAEKRAPGGGAAPARPGARRSGHGPAPQGRRARRPRRTALSLVVILGVASVAGVAVAVFSGERVPGQSSTGIDLSGPAGRLAEAHTLETEGRAADALKLYDSVLKEDPANIEALTYKGWLLARAGLTDPAMTALDQAVALNPRYPDAHFFRGMVLYQGRQDPAGAVLEFEAFLANNPPPDSVPAVREVLQRAKDDAAKSAAPPTSEAPAQP